MSDEIERNGDRLKIVLQERWSQDDSEFYRWVASTIIDHLPVAGEGTFEVTDEGPGLYPVGEPVLGAFQHFRSTIRINITKPETASFSLSRKLQYRIVSVDRGPDSSHGVVRNVVFEVTNADSKSLITIGVHQIPGTSGPTAWVPEDAGIDSSFAEELTFVALEAL